MDRRDFLRLTAAAPLALALPPPAPAQTRWPVHTLIFGTHDGTDRAVLVINPPGVRRWLVTPYYHHEYRGGVNPLATFQGYVVSPQAEGWHPRWHDFLFGPPSSYLDDPDGTKVYFGSAKHLAAIRDGLLAPYHRPSPQPACYNTPAFHATVFHAPQGA